MRARRTHARIAKESYAPQAHHVTIPAEISKDSGAESELQNQESRWETVAKSRGVVKSKERCSKIKFHCVTTAAEIHEKLVLRVHCVTTPPEIFEKLPLRDHCVTTGAEIPEKLLL